MNGGIVIQRKREFCLEKNKQIKAKHQIDHPKRFFSCQWKVSLIWFSVTELQGAGNIPLSITEWSWLL